MTANETKGTVYLIGAGPGDPGLITVRGQECINTADVVVYDYLASPALLAHARSSAEYIYVGKKGGDHTLPQGGINQLLIDKASQGLNVARLKGGDPFVFGRGGEEAEELIAAGIKYEVVPGVTAGVAATAYAGIPVTHRQFTPSVAFVTGHEDPTKETSGIDWKALATGIGTVVFYMGVKNLPMIVERLTANGRPSDTPVALVRWGTTTRQQTVTGTLATIEAEVKAAKLKAPAIIIVGGVVSLRETLNWFEEKPLFGKNIVVTRAREQASALCDRLRDLGANCTQIPTIQVAPPEDNSRLEQAIEQIKNYHWLVFTSVNGVKYFFETLFAKGLDVRVLGHLKTACIGPATAELLRSFGINSDILPATYRAESVVDAFKEEDLTGKKVLLPRAREARPILPVELKKMGADVDEITSYETLTVPEHQDELLSLLEAGAVDLVTFTSSSTVKNFMDMLPESKEDQKRLMNDVTVASIGPITSDTARDLGLTVHVEADEYTIPGLVDVILKS